MEPVQQGVEKKLCKVFGELKCVTPKKLNGIFNYEVNIFQITITFLENLQSISKIYNIPDRFNGECKIFQQLISSSFIYPIQNIILKINSIKTLKNLFHTEILDLSITNYFCLSRHIYQKHFATNPR